MRTIAFDVPGNPRGKQRARSTKSGHHYTPAETVTYEAWIRTCYQQAAVYAQQPGPMEGPVRLDIVAQYPIPASWSEKRQRQAAALMMRPMVKPDIDNVIKAVMDALNGIAWKDDKQVVRLAATKHYGRMPMLRIIVEEVL